MSAATLAPPAAVPAAAGTSRWGWVDAARGIAIIAAVAYHFVWDLGAFGWIEPWNRTPVGVVVGRVIAATFLFLVGFSFALAHRRSFHAPAYARRTAKILCCAVLVTLGSLVSSPTAWVSFGILHNIVVTSVLLVPFLGRPRWVALAGAATAFALPSLVTIHSASRWVTWLGLSSAHAPTMDYQPLFPFFGVSLLGYVIARTMIGRRPITLGSGTDLPSRWLRALGRRTLWIYLLHQPVLYGIFSLIGHR